MSMRLFESLATTEPLADAFSDGAVLAAMLRFEVALARAEAGAGVIPTGTSEAIARAATPADFDAGLIASKARASGTITIPFVESLTARVRAHDPDAATFVHWGATSQDVSDTALVLCLLQARKILSTDHERLSSALRGLSDQHADTIMLARTLLQPAGPTTFGLKVAGWHGALARTSARLWAGFDDACVLQFGGASGTLAALGTQAPAVAEALARQLGLRCPDAPWHAHRDRLGSLVTACGVYTAALGKIARDISLLMQHEVGEAAEPGGGSSSMPHKRNPAGCAVALAAAGRVPGLVASFLAGMPQEHERGLGGWHAESTTVIWAIQTMGASLAAMADVAENLSVNPERMRANLASTRGFVFAERAMVLLARPLGRQAAARLIDAALEASARDGRNFVEVLSGSPEVAAALPPGTDLASAEDYLGSAELFRCRLLGKE